MQDMNSCTVQTTHIVIDFIKLHLFLTCRTMAYVTLSLTEGGQRDRGAVECHGGLRRGQDIDKVKGVVPTTCRLPAALI